MEILKNKFLGVGKDISALQMAARALVIFVIAFLLIRVAGSGEDRLGCEHHSITLSPFYWGAVLSRAVVGASPFLPVIFFASALIVVLHRICGLLISRNKMAGKFFEGEKILLFENGGFISANMKRALVSNEDIMQWIRKTALTEDLDKIDKVYMEKNGQISATKKQ